MDGPGRALEPRDRVLAKREWIAGEASQRTERFLVTGSARIVGDFD